MFKDLPTAELLVAACVIAAAVMVFIAIRRTLQGYERAFVGGLGSRLQQSFILADPQRLFVISIAITCLGAGAGYLLIGPVGAVGASIVGISLPRLLVALMAKQRVKKFVYQLPDALLA